MKSLTIDLYKARDAEESYAVRLPGEDRWRASEGYGGQFERVWSVEFQSTEEAPETSLDWDALLERAIEAYEMSDPVVSNFRWPQTVM